MWSTQGAGGAEDAGRGRSKIILYALTAVGLLGPLPVRAEEPRYETVVTAPPAGASPAREDMTASASVITTERTPRSGESLTQLLSELPGVAVTRLGAHGAFATASIRGSSPNQVQLYVDGVPLGSAATGAVDLGLVPLLAADRIELYRGSTPLAFGSSAMGGIIALTSEPPQASAFGAHSGVGSFGTRMLGAHGAWVGARAQVGARLALFDSRGDFPYRSDNGTLFDRTDDENRRRENNALAQRDAALRAAIALEGRRQIVLALSALDREQGLPSAGTVQSVAASLETRRILGSASYEGRDDLGQAGRVKATLYGLAAEQRFRDTLGEIAFGPTDTRDRSGTFGATLAAQRAVGAAWRLAGMVDARREEFHPRDRLAREARPRGSRSFAAAGVELDAWWARLDLDVVPSLRVEAAHDEISHVDLYGGRTPTAEPANHLLPIARLGLLQRPAPGVRVRANVARYARLPTLAERYGNGGVIVGNPALAPEAGFNADLGVAAGGATVLIDAAVFASDARDLIHFQKGSYHARYRNIGRARVLGGELTGTARLLRFAHLVGQTTFVDARDTSGHSASDGKQLPHRPRFRAYARPELRDVPVSDWLAFGLYGDVDITDGTYADVANLVRLPGRLLVGAGASLVLPRSGLRLSASGYNLGDTRGSDVLGFPLPGRSLFLTLHFAYSPRQFKEPTR